MLSLRGDLKHFSHIDRLAQIRRRLHAIREGRVVLRDWDEALAKIRQSLVSKANS
jgi:hypothetical protein